MVMVKEMGVVNLIGVIRMYDIERVMALLNYEEIEERKWKIEIAQYLKLHRDHKEEMRKKNEIRKREMEIEMEEIERRAHELRDKGLCKVKFDPYRVEYKTLTRRHVKIRMDLLNSNPDMVLKLLVQDLKGSPLIEECIAMEEIEMAIIANAKKDQEMKDRRAAEIWAKVNREAAISKGPGQI